LAATAGSSTDRIDAATWRIAGTIVLGGMMTNVDTTVVNVALESLARDFGASVSRVQWVATGYLLALAIVIPLSGWATDRFGGKRVWIASIGMFLAGSMLAGAAWSLGSLIFFRVLQGLGGGMITPVGMTLLTRAAVRARVGRVMGALGVQQVVGPVLGPVIGGVLVEHAGWRWIFYVNVPIGVLGIVAAARFLPRALPQPGDRLDVRGFLLLSPGMAALVYGLSQISERNGFSDPRTFIPIVLGISLVTAFVFHARRARNALIDVHLFAGRAFSAGVATTFCIGMALFGALFLLPLYYQGARGQSPLDAGLLMAPQGVGAALAMPFAGKLTDRIGGGRVAFAGMVLVTLATIPFASVGADTSYMLLAPVLVLRGIGIGSAMMPAMAAAYATLTHADVPRATSALNVLQRVGGSVGTALLAVVLQHQIATQLEAAGVAGGAAGSGVLQRVPEDVRQKIAEPVATAFGNTFWWAVGMSALAIVPTFVLARSQQRARRAQRLVEVQTPAA
jgi:EmrB/QacA subfamily drug resistance transporter